MIVGYEFEGHNERRNIIGIAPDIAYQRVYSVSKFIQRMTVSYDELMPNFPLANAIDRQFRFDDLRLKSVDVIHFFNTISFAKKPWITTFETIVPRFKNTLSLHHGSECHFESIKHDRRVLKAMAALSGDPCKRLIAMSECNLQMQKDVMRLFPQYYTAIDKKLLQLHPPQPLLVDSYENKQLSLSGPIHFIFVGSSFFRKGGMEILEAFSNAIKVHGHSIKLTIVSSLTIDDYATKETKQDVELARNFIRNNRSWINYYEFLSNKDVLKLMKSAHVGLLPTYADTYGYSVLEFQACGCPVISTDVRALPEINNDKVGWVIHIPKNHLGEAVYTTRESRSKIGFTIRQGLEKIIDEIMENRQLISQKGIAALIRVKEQHSPEIFSMKLRDVYLAIL